jgi:TPR repeat protein
MTPAQIAEAQKRAGEWRSQAAQASSPTDASTVVERLRAAAANGDSNAMYNLGVSYHDGQGVPRDYAQAVAWYRKAVDLGHVAAMNNLGFMHRNGQGMPQDYAQAAAWYRKAADLGSPPP